MSALLRAGVEQDLLRRDPIAANAKLVSGLDLVAGGMAPFEDLLQLWLTWYARGRDTGAVIDLSVAESLAGAMTMRAITETEHDTAQNYLGLIHHIRGEREQGLARLNRAIDAFEAALTH